METTEIEIQNLYKKITTSKTPIPLDILYSRLSEVVLKKFESVVLMKDENPIHPKMEPHQHSFYEILLIEEGTIKYQIGNKIYSVQQGDIIILCPLAIHRPIFSQDGDNTYKRIVLWISAEYLEQESRRNAELNYIFTWCKKMTFMYGILSTILEKYYSKWRMRSYKIIQKGNIVGTVYKCMDVWLFYQQ